jgi:2-iminobutanoate/2-iminopropanoate deaminase
VGRTGSAAAITLTRGRLTAGWAAKAGRIDGSLQACNLGGKMSSRVETFTPTNTPRPIGPYNHIARVGQFISIGGTAGVNPASGDLAGPDVYSQAKQILESFRVMLESVGSDLNHVTHVNVFLKDMRDFEGMNRAYVEKMGGHRPARTVIGVNELPQPGVLLTMNLTAVTRESV